MTQDGPPEDGALCKRALDILAMQKSPEALFTRAPAPIPISSVKQVLFRTSFYGLILVSLSYFFKQHSVLDLKWNRLNLGGWVQINSRNARTVSKKKKKKKNSRYPLWNYWGLLGAWEAFMQVCNVIRFVSTRTKCGTFTVVSVNGTLVEDKMHRFKGVCVHIASTIQHYSNSHETDNSVERNIWQTLYNYKLRNYIFFQL